MNFTATLEQEYNNVCVFLGEGKKEKKRILRKKRPLSPRDKDKVALREEIKRETEIFLKGGGRLTVLDAGKRAIDTSRHCGDRGIW